MAVLSFPGSHLNLGAKWIMAVDAVDAKPQNVSPKILCYTFFEKQNKLASAEKRKTKQFQILTYLCWYKVPTFKVFWKP